MWVLVRKDDRETKEEKGTERVRETEGEMRERGGEREAYG